MQFLPRLPRRATRFLTAILCLGGLLAGPTASPLSADEDKKEVYGDFNYGDSGKDKKGADWVDAVFVSEPAYRSEVQGEVTVKFQAKGMTQAKAMLWQQPTDKDKNEWGHDENLTPGGIKLDAQGNGTFTFNADEFPNGPINVRIFAQNEAGKKDICELQLFNTGGVKWNQGIPDRIPPAIEGKGLKLIFEDDFDGPLSISADGRGARYSSRKPRMGDFSGWQFTEPIADGKPFSQQGTWLRIAARKDEDSPKGRSGLIASVNFDGEGVWAKAPAYLECRFTAQSATTTWPAFWTITQVDRYGRKVPGDELDIIEAYGGNGPGRPNHPGYSLVTHPWRQTNPDGSKKKHPGTKVPMMELGGKSYWSTTFHTYAVFIGEKDTVYYFDDIEVFRHPSNDISVKYPHLFLINLALGGISGWPIDMSRYNEGTDMWVDYVRVYAKEDVPDYSLPLPPLPEEEYLPKGTAAIGLNFYDGKRESATLRPTDETGATGFAHGNWNNLSGTKGNAADLTDNSGKKVPGLKVDWSVDGEGAEAALTWYWGFEVHKRTLLRNALQPKGKVTLTGIPFKKYDVFVYLGADDLGGSGEVSLSSPDGDVDANGTYFLKTAYSKSGGTFTASKATKADAAEAGSMVVFSGNTAKDITLEWDGTLGEKGWTGVAGVQIVEAK